MPSTKKAVALGYNQSEQAAPKVLAKAQGLLAQSIIKIAQEHDISIFSNEALVQSLMNIDLEKEIPSQMYESMAEVFAWLYRVESDKS